ncbi:aromatic ring-hydroxylating dioxygenase subunit alpha (plasmid) [Novosphingobium resinovorum]|uniref:aromatic ring-hydroxylating oxygenase subunit alpha n=1 Tax=Novosphingobium TaxID=165696 RepID=UPI001B3C9A00|nr:MULTISPECIES: aromatic ring-hydroxylating dioxygenase subunit alpha [Novosphingobium]MBF7015251.1 aromatic ring-hydroxylating dioxygenase subunit alpha [Novosphingobium sp. HR1a]WJM29926.1 aromatic ring-hydroxylating dioxygenase subunit alpha [Novosphingobium resinovorum]
MATQISRPDADVPTPETHGGPTWDELADRDSRAVPEYLRGNAQADLGTAPLDVARYVSPEFHKLECERMWPYVWQFAAREEDIPDAGDYIVYENAGRSFLVVRQANGSVRAFHNVCLHRGRQLRESDGSTEEFRCAYHGFSWNTDGTMRRLPCQWDFGQLKDKDMSLPEAEVDCWAGYIFLREKSGGPTLREYLAPLPDHFERWGHEDAYTTKWVAKVIPANWKACAEAFMEAFHVNSTHPQITPFTGDVNSKYMMWGDHVNLAITPFGVVSPEVEPMHGEQGIIDNFLKYNSRVVEPGMTVNLEDDQSARAAMGEINRKRFGVMFGRDLDHISDSEVQDALTYNVFPNFSPWGGMQPTVVYRWRPWHDADHCLMEVRLMSRRKPGEEVEPATMLLLDPSDSFQDELGQLGAILEQDMGNLPYVQKGMKQSANRELQLAQYQESRIRHFHHTLDKYLERNAPPAD